MTYPERIEGEVGVYERWDVGRHTDALAELGTDAEVMRFLGGVQSRAASEELSLRLEDHWATFGFGLWACVDGAGRCRGFTGACRPGPYWSDQFGDEVEVGWRIERSAWGLGLATEGARLAVTAAEEELGLERLIAFVDPDNTRSRAVTQRLGMARLTGTVDPMLGTTIDVMALSLAPVAVA